jgi:hypothetical protein
VPGALTPKQRKLRGQYGAYKSWANTADPSARTKPAREAFIRKFEDQVDPDRALDPEERRRRAEAARKAHYKHLAYQSARARTGRKGGAPDGEAA